MSFHAYGSQRSAATTRVALPTVTVMRAAISDDNPKIPWWATPPVDTLPPANQPQHSVAYLEFKAKQRKMATEEKKHNLKLENSDQGKMRKKGDEQGDEKQDIISKENMIQLLQGKIVWIYIASYSVDYTNMLKQDVNVLSSLKSNIL